MKLVIFDMDGVLVDSEPIYHHFHPYYFETQLGITLSQEELDNVTGVAPREIFGRFKTIYPDKLPEPAVVYVEREYDLLMEKFASLEPLPLVPGIAEVLATLQEQQIPMVLSSSNQRRMIELCLDRSGFRPYFQNILSGEDVPRSKPDPEIFLRQAAFYGVKPEECLVIEDSTNGCRAAKAAGMACLGYVNPNSGNQDLSLADWRIDSWNDASLSQLMTILNSTDLQTVL